MKRTVFLKDRIFDEKDGLLKTRVFFLLTYHRYKKAIVNCTLPFFTNTNLLKMANNYDQWLEDYKKTVQYGLDYDRWLKDLKKTDRYMSIVAKHKQNWRKIHDQLLAIFNNELKLRREDEEGNPLLKIDVSQRDNYNRQFRAWMAEIKDTCPNRKLYFGRSYGIKEHLRYSRYFFKHLWDPEKTVDESLMKALLGSNWDKHYDYTYE